MGRAVARPETEEDDMRKLPLVAAMLLLVPAAAFAQEFQRVPTLGEVGLISLGIALASGGLLAMRRRKR